MKILYVITKSNWGGAQKHVYDLAVGMKEKGHTTVVALGGDGILRKHLEDAGIKTHTITKLTRDMSLAKDSGSFWDIYKIIKRERPDVLHLHSPKAAGLGALAGRMLRAKKIVYTVHGWTFNEDRPMVQKGMIAFFSWLTVILCHKTILLSEREYNQALLFPKVKAKLVLITPGMRQPVFMSIDGAKQFIGKMANIDLAELGKKMIIGTIAELHANKGLSYLIKAMEQIRETHPNTLCVILGDGEEKEKLAAMIASAKLEDNVKLLGYIEDASHYLKALNIFILPSLKEGLPYALLEAGFASLPVISTTVGGIPEIVEDMKSGVLVQPKNSKELAHSISFMIEHPVMRRQYGTALRDAVMQKFSLQKMIDSVEELYLCHSREGGNPGLNSNVKFPMTNQCQSSNERF